MRILAWVAGIWILCVSSGIAQIIHVEAEDGQTSGTRIATQRLGYSGKGYVTAFESDTAKLTLHAQASKAGIYEMSVRFCSPSGEKGYDIAVNGIGMSGMFPKTDDRFSIWKTGRVELNEGTNEIVLRRGWGYYEVDWIEFSPITIAPVAKPPNTLSDPAATDRARALMGFLVDHYGEAMLSGGYGEQDNDYVHQITGKTNAIVGGDLMDYSPSRVARSSEPKDGVEQCIRLAKAGQILTLSWHWNAPKDLIDKMLPDGKGGQIDAMWYKGFYTDATTFDLSKAIADEHSPDYQLLLHDIDAIAIQLKKISDANIPVLWRPLHEAEGGWFWWGAKGPLPFKKLWQLMHHRLTEYHHLHNLIWVYTSGGNPDWYPGDAYVDIVGIDAYLQDTHDPQTEMWDRLTKQFGGKKLLTVSEFGGVPDAARMRQMGCWWSYFVSWTGDVGPHKMTQKDLREIYNSADVINLSSERPWLEGSN